MNRENNTAKRSSAGAKPMTVAELITVLQSKRQDAVPVINGTVILGVKELNGKVEQGYFGPIFKENPKGDSSVRYQAITFTHIDERSDGEVAETHYW